MIRFCATVVLLVICSGCWSATDPPINTSPTAGQIYADALANAQAANKPVFILFTQDEFWCQRLEGYFEEEEVARLFDKYFVLVSIRLDATPGGEQMYYERGGGRGVPAYTLVDASGNLLADSGDEGQNIGFPNTDDEVQRFLEIVKTACPAITDDELALLRGKLEARRLADITNN
jgi:hypothetical protein